MFRLEGIMLRSISTIFLVLLLGLQYEHLSGQDSRPATLEGVIINAENQEPLPGAHIFLAGTTIGTHSDSEGRYRLEEVPAGAHRVAISMVGFGLTAKDTLVTAGKTHKFNFSIHPVTIEMSEVQVELDDDWYDDLDRFYDLFIGTSSLSDSVEIINPEVLSFESRWWGRFTAEASEPLVIENRSLGYRITYYLDEFRHSGLVTRWDGEPLFEELRPKDESQQQFWEKNRKKAFYGSVRHFLLTLIHDRVREEGFVIYEQRRDIRGISSQNEYRARASRLISQNDEEGLYDFNFSGRLKVIYTKEGEDHRYVQWARDVIGGPAHSQTSYLELNERPITIDTDGEILQTYGATRYGHFSFRRIADRTPREYRPEVYYERGELLGTAQ